MMADKILVFVPCYNCAPQVGRVLGQLRGSIARYVDEILILDNGSKDGTAEAAIEAAPGAEVPKVTIGRNQANYNLGGSHKSAFGYAQERGFTHVITLHGDDQGDIRDIEPVLARGDHHRFDACMGARFATGSRLQGYSKFRIFGNHVFNLIFSAAAGRRITDLGSGLNLMARPAFADPAILRLPDDLTFNAFLVLDMIGSGRKVSFFPISWREEDQVSNVKMASQALRTIVPPRDYAFARKRFRAKDYRTVKHERYAFDVVAAFQDGQRLA
jgi:glycosyltransferase involved in cell wall biosynthesis